MMASQYPGKKNAKTSSVGSLVQLRLDFGQKHFGPVTCKCGMVYNTFDEQDIAEHRKFHNLDLSIRTFSGWKNERLVKVTQNGRVILVMPSDPKRHVQKVLDITQAGADWRKVFLYISEKYVQGYLVIKSSDEMDSGWEEKKEVQTLLLDVAKDYE